MVANESGQIIRALHRALDFLSANPYPHVPTPEGCNKRASVAIIIRVRPAYVPPVSAGSSPPASQSQSQTEDSESASTTSGLPPSSLKDFFAQEWVHKGDPEVLFIKRASHKGDRWSGHVALPGGKRDPGDADDFAAAVREAREEVGLDLSSSCPWNCIPAGNLPERVVAQTWGSSPLMVLCPYIFLLTGQEVHPGVKPQPTEVASAHWVPLRALLSPALRTREYVDTSGRMAGKYGWLARGLLRASIGRMCFSAIRLAPSESVHASSTPGFLPAHDEGETRLQSFLEGALGIPSPSKRNGLAYQAPLLLWGLTLGVMADFLDMLPPYNAVKLWLYPTFTTPDLRFIVWILTRNLRRNNAGDLSAGTWGREILPGPTGASLPVASGGGGGDDADGNPTAIDDKFVAAPTTAAASTTITTTTIKTTDPSTSPTPPPPPRCRKNDVGISGLGIGSDPARRDSVSRLLVGYYQRISVAIVVFLAYRTALAGGLAWWAYKRWWWWKSGFTRRVR